MTGKELVLFILENNLENEEVFKDGGFVGFITIEEAAIMFGVGLETVRTWYIMGMIRGIHIGNTLYFPKNIKSPWREETY